MAKSHTFQIPSDPVERDRFFQNTATMLKAKSSARYLGKIIIDRELAEITLKLLECLEPDDFGRMQSDKRYYEEFELLIQDWKKQLNKKD